ncbi:zinc finger CCHC domain-containing protein 7 [Megalobrama amblycephala]|uniref:zinc finger CCHC domain-containing protein 7 n=1 Tax=Megalobrama amblycephala TaxID=75352 RepID=UPI002013DF7D|nr:zinc finger CCHC domain-containing protein 7 [Megalobrama amblycephala]XP_048053585.1 zinc finger CCHC domain-containing protein 7 [Megalobrama amblycephala]
MFSGYQEREDYEDELYRDDADSSLSDADSELEFRLYSQLHYNAEIQEDRVDPREVKSSVPRTQPQQNSLPPAPPVDVIVIDSGTDAITVSDNTEEDDSVCAIKGQSTKIRNRLLQPNSLLSPCPPQVQTGRSSSDVIVVLDSESDESSSESIPPFVEDLDSDSDSDSDRLENWMILGQEKHDEDQSIQLNLSISEKPEHANDGGDIQNWAVSEKDKWAQICNKRVGLRQVSNRFSNRYYVEKSVTCHNCRKTGHLSKNCPTPKKLPCCSLCGLLGHLLRTCPNRHCSNCSLPGHTYDDCLEKAYWHKCCHRCGMTGHFIDACPEIWRQYHLTTTLGPLCKSSDPEACRKPAYCYNCSRKGHFGHECSQRRMYNGTYPTLPFISYYDTTKDFNCREHRIKKKARELQDAGLIPPDGGSFTSTPQPPRKKQKTSHKQSPYPHSAHTNNQHTPKRHIAHTPKHHPQAYQKNTHFSFKHNSQTPGNYGKGSPQSKFIPQQQSQKEAKKKKKGKSAVTVLDEDAAFPRGGKKGPRMNKPFGKDKNDKKKTNKTTKKKERKLKKREQKAAKDSSMYPSDENLFQIKQRNVRKR